MQAVCSAVVRIGTLVAMIAQSVAAPLVPASPDPIFLTATGAGGGKGLPSSVESVITAIESAHGRIRPDRYPRIGLKVYTHSGPGLRTPLPVVRAVIDALLARGYSRDALFICDLDAFRLRDAGFLPPLSRGGRHFEGVPVIALNDPQRIREDWFYDSPLPPTRFEARSEFGPREAYGDDRKSFLPAPLLFDADYWINLPVFTDHQALGINGALANMTLWAVTNQERFFDNRVSAAAAAAEIAAIPEYRATYGFTLASLDTVQFIGGPPFDANFTAGMPLVIASRDAVAIDRFALHQINTWRTARGFQPIPTDLPLFRYAESLDLGNATLSPPRFQKPGDTSNLDSPNP